MLYKLPSLSELHRLGFQVMRSVPVLQAPLGAAGQDSSAAAAPAEPVKAPQEPMVRDVMAALPLPAEVDELLREHCRFLYKEGTAC